jgi:hypothetical protein
MRTKTVGDMDFVIDTWIAQEQPEARTPYVNGKSNIMFQSGATGHTGHRLYFRGKTIFSYHDWWPLGRLLDDGCALVNGDFYSVTTRKHRYAVESALQRAGIPYFNVSGVEQSPAYLLEEFKKQYEKVLRMRDKLTRDWPMYQLKQARAHYLFFCDHFNEPVEFDLTKEQWKALALRIKFYHDRQKLKQFAKRLTQGKE